MEYIIHIASDTKEGTAYARHSMKIISPLEKTKATIWGLF